MRALQEGRGVGMEWRLGLKIYGVVSCSPLAPERMLVLCWGICFTSRTLFSLSFYCAISLSTFLAEGSVVGTGWRCTQNGLSQTIDCAVRSVWDPKEEV